MHRGKVEKSESKKRTCSDVSVRQRARGVRGVSREEEKAGHGGKDLQNIEVSFISGIFISYQGFLVRPLLRKPRPQVHYKSQPDATAQRETQKSTNVKSLTKIE